MAGQTGDGDANFLRRWSQRKLAAARQATTAPPPVASTPATGVPPGAAPVGASANPVEPQGTSPPPDLAAVAGDQTPPLPPVESLGFDSDFTRFLAPKVDEAVKRQALRKLFNDPRFNVMDGLDVYIDDYSKFEPIPDDLVAKLKHARYIFDPPRTRVNEAGHVEDVPDEPTPGSDAAKPADALPVPSEDAVPPQEGDAVLPGPAPDDTAREPELAPRDDRTDPR